MKYGLNLEVDGSIIVFAIICATGIIYRHRTNIQRLKDGTENRVGQSKKTVEPEVQTEQVQV